MIPARLLPDLNPGGLVVQVYSLDGRLLLDGMITSEAPELNGAAHASRFMAEHPDERAIVVAVYDGDTGQLFASETFR